MIYVVSDIHGMYDKYIEMLDVIDLKDEDTLFVLGDVIDRGKDSLKILMDMMYRSNVIPILGNHEYMALSLLKKMNSTITDELVEEVDNEEFIQLMTDWLANGGGTTFTEFTNLNTEERLSILDYLEEFRLYDEVTVNSIDYVLVHAGLDNFSKDKQLNDYSIYELIWNSLDYSKKYYEDKVIITGHTPVQKIMNDVSYCSIYKNNNNIAIDCGCIYEGKLAILCLDTMKEYYI